MSSSISSPERFIFNDDDMEKFRKSPAKANLLRLVSAMGKSCAASGLSYQYNSNDPTNGLPAAMAVLHGSLKEMLNWLTDLPPDDRSKARFGNPSFRRWHARLVSRCVSVVHTILKTHQQYPGTDTFDKSVLAECTQTGRDACKIEMTLDSVPREEDREAVAELCAYLSDSFGHPLRLDFGTGHESSFQVFLYALCRIGCFGSTQNEPPSMERLKAITISLYHAYLKVTRQLQTEYVLEPAGSHGVWGLDDYHCLPFYFGACQLQAEGSSVGADNPTSIHDEHVLQKQGDTYLYLGCIRYIKSLKKGAPFFESSPMLNDISNLPTWQKVASGLLRLYEGEVLDKRQVVQHFVFGKIFAADWEPSESPQKPPTDSTFRNPVTTQQGLSVAPMTRAPWADMNASQELPPATKTAPGTRTVPMTSAKAPWAK